MFGLFGTDRKTATRAAVEALRPIIGSIQHTHGLPARFWTDPYVLGFMQFTIGWHAKLATNGKITGSELGLALADSLTALSNMNGPEIVRRISPLQNDPDFNRGADDAATVTFYTYGKLKNEQDNPLVQRATEVVDKQGSPLVETGRRARIAAMMFTLSFYAEFLKRFD